MHPLRQKQSGWPTVRFVTLVLIRKPIGVVCDEISLVSPFLAFLRHLFFSWSAQLSSARLFVVESLVNALCVADPFADECVLDCCICLRQKQNNLKKRVDRARTMLVYRAAPFRALLSYLLCWTCFSGWTAVLMFLSRPTDSCYLFPADKPDPCIDLKCPPGAKCIAAPDASSATCQCPTK